jgi:hypothetical protein
VVEFLDDVIIDGTVTAKRIKLTDSASDEMDFATKEYVDNTVDAKFDEIVTGNGLATKDELEMEREARERDINDLNEVLISKVNYTYFEDELRKVKDDQTNKDSELQTDIGMLRDYSDTNFATKQELGFEITTVRSICESAIAYEIDSLKNRFETDLHNLNYIETLTVNGIQQTVANRIVDVDLSNYATKTELSDKSDKLTCVTVEKDFYGDYYTHTYVLKNVSDHAIISGVVSYNNIRIPISGIFSHSHSAEYVLREDIRVQKDSYTNCLDILVFAENGQWELAQPSRCGLDLIAINL